MHVIIDQGNTALKAGWFEGDTLLRVEYCARVEELLPALEKERPEVIAVSSVGAKEENIKKVLERYGKIRVIDNSWPLPVVNNYATPKTLGIDRIAAVVGAWTLYPGENCLVIDLGTCITYDVLDAGGVYHGGNITPGLHMRHAAMAHFTARLPNPGVNLEVPLVGNGTDTALQSGVLYGVLGEIEGMIARYRHQYGPLRVCLTGGDASAFESKLKEPIFAVRNLVLTGLNTILRQHAA